MGRPKLTLLAGCLVTVTLGSIHAYSVLLTALENRFESSRADISLIYSLALVFLTLSVLLGYRLYRLVSPPALVLIACWGAGFGLLPCVVSTEWWLLCLGYSVVFGTANGIGYGYVLQLVALAMPRHKGFAVATVTAVYAVGATAFSKLFAELLLTQSLEEALAIAAASIALAGALRRRHPASVASSAILSADTRVSRLCQDVSPRFQSGRFHRHKAIGTRNATVDAQRWLAYDTAKESMGMSPTSWRDGAKGETIHYAVADCHLGRVIVAGTARGICAIEFDDEDRSLVEGLRTRFPNAALAPAGKAFSGWLRTVLTFVESPQEGLDLCLDIRGTAFQERV